MILEKDGSIVLEMKYCTEPKEGRSILYTIKRRKANWIGHISSRKCLLKHVIEGNDIIDGKMRKKT